jgi:hypothetical protein
MKKFMQGRWKMLKQYDVTFHLRRYVTITVDCDSGDDPEEYALDQLKLQENEEVTDTEVNEGDPSGE